MLETLTQEQTEKRKLLRAIVEGALEEYLERNQSDISNDMARELHEDGMFNAVPHRPIAGRASYLDAKITSRGRDRLAELEQLSVVGHAGEPAYNDADKSDKWHNSALGKIIIGIVVAVMAGGLFWSIGHWWNNLFL